jgi:capsular polysaccharide biosynthesis protein
MENFFDNRRILQSIWKWRIHLLIVVILAVVVSSVISSSYFIKPKYKSTARLYPVNLAEYSEESESEQLLEFIRTNDLKFRVIDAFNLPEVYKINRQDPLYVTYILDKYNKNVSFKKTEFETIEIKVLDENPQRACEMVDSIIHFFNEKIQQLHGEKYLEVYDIAIRDIQNKSKDIDSISTMLHSYTNQFGLLDYSLQVKAASEGLMDAAANNGNTKPSKEMLQNLTEKGIEFNRLQMRLTRNQMVMDSLLMIRDFALSHATKKITYAIVAEKPFPADKKSFPVRWLIVLLSTVSALAFSIVSIVLIDYIRASKQN